MESADVLQKKSRAPKSLCKEGNQAFLTETQMGEEETEKAFCLELEGLGFEGLGV